MTKKIYTRQEFEDLRIKSARDMAEDTKLYNDALQVKVKAGHDYYWVHQTNWMGEPCLQLAQDLLALQEIIYQTRPKFIIESGVAWGGSLLMYATLMEILGGDKIIAIDTYIPDDLKERLAQHEKIAHRIQWIKGSSTASETITKVKEIIGDSKEVMVLLDSDHTHDHVLKELEMYSPLVGKGHYLVCGDTIIDRQPPAPKRPRPWGSGNNPMTALKEFLKQNNRFVVDKNLENKLLLSNMPNGYLKCIKS